MKTQISKVSVEFVGGNKVAFEAEDGVDLSKVKTVRSILTEEIKSLTPAKEEKAAS